MALRGVKVLELSGLAPAPFCGMILSDFGAQVTRIDRIGANTDLDPLGTGKRSIALNLKHPDGVKIVRELSRRSDVLIEPFRAGIMEKLGLGPEVLLQHDNPGLIYARLTGYGQVGLYSARAGHDINYLGLSGLLSLFGRANQKPVFPVNLAADFGGGGLTCALGILLALYERTRSGRGQVIDANMVEGTAYLGSWLFRSQTLPLWGRERGRNYLDSGAHFYDVYETQDGKYMAVGALEAPFYSHLMAGLGLNEDSVAQLEDFERGKEVVAARFKQRTQQEWCQVFDGVDACVTPVLSLEEAPRHRHNAERGSFVAGVPRPAPNLDRTPGRTSGDQALPQTGQHTWAILQDLGYEEGEVNRLVTEGVVECFNKSKL